MELAFTSRISHSYYLSLLMVCVYRWSWFLCQFVLGWPISSSFSLRWDGKLKWIYWLIQSFRPRWENGQLFSLCHPELGNLIFGFCLVSESGRSPSTDDNFTQIFLNTVHKLFPSGSLPGFTISIWLLLIMVAIIQNHCGIIAVICLLFCDFKSVCGCV